MITKLLTITFAVSVFYSGNLLALDLDPSEIRGTDSKQPVKVLQSRFFNKTMRPELGFLIGNIRDEAYLKSYTHGFRASMFVNEWFGFEGQYITTTVKDSADRKALNELVYRPIDESEANTYVSPDPEVNAVHRIIDLNGIAAPFYGKINLIDKMIVYFDFYLSGGISQVDTDQGKKNAFNIGLGQRFYFTNNLSFRIDVRDRFYSEQRNDKETSKESITIDFGLSYFLL